MEGTRRFGIRGVARGVVMTLGLSAVLASSTEAATLRYEDQKLTWANTSLPAGSRLGESVAMSRTSDTAFAAAPQGKGWHLFQRVHNGTGLFLAGSSEIGGGDNPSFPACSDEFLFGAAVVAVTVHTSGTSRVQRPGSSPYVSGIEGGDVRALASADDVIAVGQPLFAGNSGRVLIYRWDSSQSTWELDATLFGAAGEHFGASVALRDSSTLIVGGPAWGDNGRARVFVHAAGTWGLWQTLESPALGQTGARFGATVAADGPWIAVGSPNFDRLGVNGAVFPDIGSVYLYRPSGLQWTLEQVARPPSLANYDWYGSSIALRQIGGTGVLVAGAIGTDGDSLEEGSVYVWTLSGDGTWKETWQLVASDATQDLFFGVSVALGPSGILVGAPGAEANGLTDQGAAYYFDHLVPLFADDFESGDTGAWSAAIP